MKRSSPGCVLITGASRGIGRALALAYAAPDTQLGLIGRDGDSLEQTAATCRNLGAEVEIGRLDVRDGSALEGWITTFDARHPVDLVIANAGIASTLGPESQGEDWERLRQIFDTNLHGVLATVQPLLARMCTRGHGQIALMSSLGAYVGMPISPAYNASKAAVKIYGEGLRGVLARHGVGVSVICPGFVQSEMSEAYPGPRPFMVGAEDAAARIREGLARNRALIAFPWPLTLTMRALSLLPTDLSLALQHRFRF